MVSSLPWSEFDYMLGFDSLSAAPVGAVPWLRSMLFSKGKRQLSERLFTQREREVVRFASLVRVRLYVNRTSWGCHLAEIDVVLERKKKVIRETLHAEGERSGQVRVIGPSSILHQLSERLFTQRKRSLKPVVSSRLVRIRVRLHGRRTSWSGHFRLTPRAARRVT